MKPAIEVARETWVAFRREHPGQLDFVDVVHLIATAIAAARREGQEDMRERCAAQAEAKAQHVYDGMAISAAIRELEIT